MNPPRISIIVPTINEGENIPLLIPRIGDALPGRDWEVLIVDDGSTDQTPRVCDELARTYPLRLITRTSSKNGLSGAVLHGFAHASGDVLVVMDADLQHPPEKLLELVAAVEAGADMAIGSRYAGGSTQRGWGAGRRINSWLAVCLARPFARGVSDPMSGFFALSRQKYQSGGRFVPMGYKIALELMHKCDLRDIREVPIAFGVRHHGESKLGLRQRFDYLQHLSRLYDFAFPRASPIIKFAIVIALGFAAAVGVFVLLRARQMPAAAAVGCGYLAHIGVTAIFHARYIHAQREFIRTTRPWLEFAMINVGEILAVGVVAWWLNWRAPAIGGMELLTVAFVLGTAVRYVLRKELMQDVRGLRRDARYDEVI